MATYKGRTFTAACEECSKVFTATHQYKADSQATSCYETHYPKPTRDLKEALDEAWEAFGGRDGS